MKLINKATLDDLTRQAQVSPRKRQSKNYHPLLSDRLQRMLNAFEPGTYVRPHRHWDMQKREVFVILRGRLLVIFFDDAGNVTDRVILDAAQGNHAVEIAPDEWHLATALKSGTVVYEIKDGPYDATTDKQFAPWAPDENDPLADNWLKQQLANE